MTPGDLLPDDLARVAEQFISDGYMVFQKFTCEKCRTRQTMDVANVFFVLGGCEECGHITDLRVRGAGMMSLLTGRNCFVRGHGRPVRRCDRCGKCSRCASRVLRSLVPPNGLTMDELAAIASRGEPIEVMVCASDCAVPLAG